MSIRNAIAEAIQDLKSRKKPTDWDGSEFEELRSLSVDERGQIGENLVANILKDNGCEVDFQPGATDSYGERGYDLEVDGIKLEVKIATRGTRTPSFQHENLNRQTGWDALVLIDIAPDEVFVLMRTKKELPWNSMHRRKDSSFYKYDLTVKKHEEMGNEVETVDDFCDMFDDLKTRLKR